MSDKNSNEERENADGSRPPTPDPAPNEFQFAEPAPPKRFQFLTGKFNHTSEIPKRMKDAHRREREKSNLMRKSCAHQSRAHDTINPMTEYNSENADDMSSSFNNSGMQLQGSSSRWNPPRYNDHNSTPNNDVSVRRVDERPYERRSSTPPPSRIYGNFARPYNLPRKVNQAREVDNQAREVNNQAREVGNQAREFRNQAREVGNQAREVNNQAREVVDAASAGTRNHVNPQNEFRDSSRSQEPIRPPLNRLASPIPALSLNMHHLPPPPVVPIEDEYPNDAMPHYSSEMNFYPKREAFVNSQDELQLVEDDEDLERPFETNGNDYNDNHQRLSNAEFRVHVQEPEYNHHSINRYDENWQGERGSQRDFRRDEDHANLRPLERNHNDLNGNHQQSPNSGFETDDNIQARDVHEQQQPPRRPRSASQWPENRFGQNIPQRNFYNFDDNRNFLAIVQPNANENHQEPTNTGLQPLANDAFEQQRESPPWKMAIEKWLKESEPYWRFY